MLRERVTAHGHHHVSATHRSTLEVTTDEWLTPAGDCIVGIAADRTPADFSAPFVSACQDVEATITLVLEIGNRSTRIVGRGDPALTFQSDRALVSRTSTYVDDRTVLIAADGAAADVDRWFIDRLAAGTGLQVTLEVTTPANDGRHGDDRVTHGGGD